MPKRNTVPKSLSEDPKLDILKSLKEDLDAKRLELSQLQNAQVQLRRQLETVEVNLIQIAGQIQYLVAKIGQLSPTEESEACSETRRP